MMVVKYGTTSIEYSIERKRSLKNTYINVDKHGVVVKTNEATTEEELEQDNALKNPDNFSPKFISTSYVA